MYVYRTCKSYTLLLDTCLPSVGYENSVDLPTGINYGTLNCGKLYD